MAMVECRVLSDIAKIWQCSERSPPKKGDVLIQRISGTPKYLGRVFLEPEFTLSSYVCLRPKKEIYFPSVISGLESLRRQGYWLKHHYGTVQNFIRTGDVKKVPCKLIPPELVTKWITEFGF